MKYNLIGDLERHMVRGEVTEEPSLWSADYASWLTGRPATPEPSQTGPKLKPVDFDARSGNELRPASFDEMIGQERLKALMRRIVAVARETGRPLSHMLLSGASGTGKTTLAQVTAHELGRDCYQLKAPIDFDTFNMLRTTCKDGDVVIVDEIHQQVSGDRRGTSQSPDPEVYYHVLEDRRLIGPTGVRPFPMTTFIGCTTDAGLLPDAFINRFPLRPTLDRYTPGEMARLAQINAQQLGLAITDNAAAMFGNAARANPRQLNDFVRNALALAATTIDAGLAREVVEDLNSTTLDGLDADMQKMLRFLLSSRRQSRDGEVVHQASINTIATALGRSRDTKSIALRTEPWLIEVGYVAVTHGGRVLTEAGIQRAQELP